MRPLALEIVVLYVALGAAIGLGAAIAAARARRSRPHALAATGMAAALFWPLFLPFLLAPSRGCDGGSRGEELGRAPATGARPGLAGEPEGRLLQALRATERKLDGALGGIDGREALGLAPVLTRIPEVVRILEQQARSVDEMDRLLATPAAPAAPVEGDADDDLARDLRRTREESARRLGRLRDRRRAELLRALVRLEELVAMVQLARFAREPAAGAGALVQQIAATVEALSELSTEDETLAA
jgi:hypothetical protein